MHLAFPDDRVVGHVLVLGDLDPTRVEARGIIDVPDGAPVWFTCGEFPLSSGDLAGLAAETLAHVLVQGSHADDALDALAEAGTLPAELTLGAGVTDAGLAAVPGLADGVTTLSLVSSEVTDAGLAAVASLTRLRSLTLGVKGTFVHGEPEYVPPAVGLTPIVGLAELEQLVVGVESLDDRDIAALGELPSLKHLHITKAPVGGEVLVHLKGAPLELLSLQGVFDDAAVAALASFPTLRLVGFDASSASEKAILQLRQALPELSINGEWLAPRAVHKHLAAMAG